MAGIGRLLAILLLGIGLATIALAEGEKAPAAASQAPAKATAGDDDVARMLELGKSLMGKNNPTYAREPITLSHEMRNTDGEQALGVFQEMVKRYPQRYEGWLWLGIALTETLVYSQKTPKGEPLLTESRIADGLKAFRTAYERNPTDFVCVSYYGEALMVYRRDFDTARTLWEAYQKTATTDLQRVTAYIQAARACLNSAYFGKYSKHMAAEEIKRQYQLATAYVQSAEKLCPNAGDVKEMQALLKQYQPELFGK